MECSKILKNGNQGMEAYVRFMSKCGFSTVPEMQDGIQVWTLEKHKGCKGKSYVSLAFIKENDKLRLTYPHPYDAREIKQIFDFSVTDFLYAYEQSKKVNQSAGDFYMSFDQIFFEMSYPKANKFVRFCFKVFSINPTIVKRCVRQNKNLKRKIDLEVKNSRYFEVLGLERKIIHIGGQKRENGLKNGVEIDFEKERIAKLNMKAAIKNAAIHYDLNYFKHYLEAFIQFKHSHKEFKPVSKRAEQKLLDTFISKVKDFQKGNSL